MKPTAKSSASVRSTSATWSIVSWRETHERQDSLHAVAVATVIVLLSSGSVAQSDSRVDQPAARDDQYMPGSQWGGLTNEAVPTQATEFTTAS